MASFLSVELQVHAINWHVPALIKGLPFQDGWDLPLNQGDQPVYILGQLP